MRNYQHDKYTDPAAIGLVNQLKKNGVFLNIEEALEMANKIEEATRQIRRAEHLERSEDSLRNSILKAFEQLNNGKHVKDVMSEFGINLNLEWAINGHGSLKFGSYYKGIITTSHSGTGSNLKTEEYACPSDIKIERY
jgi:hypothetical protein